LLDALELRQGVRLLGVSATGLLPAGSSPGQQLQLQLAPGPGKTGEAGGGQAGRPKPAGGPGGTPARSAAPGEAAGTPARGTPPDGPGGTPAWAKASEAVDAVRARFGAGALRP